MVTVFVAFVKRGGHIVGGGAVAVGLEDTIATARNDSVGGATGDLVGDFLIIINFVVGELGFEAVEVSCILKAPSFF